MKNEKFSYIDSYNNNKTINVDSKDLEFVQVDKKIHDVKFKSKPTTFAKDAFRRFCKNKSSVIGAIILGILVICAFVVPVAISDSPTNGASNTSMQHVDQQFLEPKIFDAGTGWWDGTKQYSHIAYDQVNQKPAGFKTNAIIENSTTIGDDEFINSYNAYAIGGYIRLASIVKTDTSAAESVLESNTFTYNLAQEYDLDIELDDQNSEDAFVNSEYRIYLSYLDDDSEEQIAVLKDYSSDYSAIHIDLEKTLLELLPSKTIYSNARVCVAIPNETDKQNQVFVKSCVISSTTLKNETSIARLKAISFSDANTMSGIGKTDATGKENVGFWSCTGYKYLFHATIKYCNFTYDTYEAVYGNREMSFGLIDIMKYQGYKYDSLSDSYYLDESLPVYLSYDVDVGIESFQSLRDDCPINSVLSQSKVSGMGVTVYTIKCNVCYYKYCGYSSMPKFIMGTDNVGKDLFKITFNGLKTSLLLGIATFVICFSFGLVWGSISGYFGGNVDIIMERFTDIISGMPWIVVMTLCILHLGSNFATFCLALCLTGWIGTSSRTRTQFYRFKRSEYILASRTLGASDMRLIFRHILPNAMGTIITGSVLMIPSVIFSEATISYLGLGLKNLDSLGVILSNNQQYLSSYSYLLLFPSAIIALIMISFNLFGNGLRDAFNPSLKGSD
ncbi:MAG: ABC transporter permease [Bacilli bacterium]